MTSTPPAPTFDTQACMASRMAELERSGLAPTHIRFFVHDASWNKPTVQLWWRLARRLIGVVDGANTPLPAEEVQALLAQGADPSARNAHLSLLNMAIRSDSETISPLLNAGARPFPEDFKTAKKLLDAGATHRLLVEANRVFQERSELSESTPNVLGGKTTPTL